MKFCWGWGAERECKSNRDHRTINPVRLAANNKSLAETNKVFVRILDYRARPNASSQLQHLFIPRVNSVVEAEPMAWNWRSWSTVDFHMGQRFERAILDAGRAAIERWTLE